MSSSFKTDLRALDRYGKVNNRGVRTDSFQESTCSGRPATYKHTYVQQRRLRIRYQYLIYHICEGFHLAQVGIVKAIEYDIEGGCQ